MNSYRGNSLKKRQHPTYYHTRNNTESKGDAPAWTQPLSETHWRWKIKYVFVCMDIYTHTCTQILPPNNGYSVLWYDSRWQHNFTKCLSQENIYPGSLQTYFMGSYSMSKDLCCFLSSLKDKCISIVFALSPFFCTRQSPATGDTYSVYL